VFASSPAAATKIQRIVTPAGIEAWLVSEPSVPLIAIDFAFRGGSSQDPDGKAGRAAPAARLLGEGGGRVGFQALPPRPGGKENGLSVRRQPRQSQRLVQDADGGQGGSLRAAAAVADRAAFRRRRRRARARPDARAAAPPDHVAERDRVRAVVGGGVPRPSL